MKLYYTNARLNGKTALLAGPFMDIARAEHYIDVCSPLFIAQDNTAVNASFGVMECNEFAGYGAYNETLRAAGDMLVPVPDS